MNGADKQVTAMQLCRAGEPLHEVRRDMPEPRGADLLIEVAACGVCRTDMHIVDGDIHDALPIVLGHEIVGHVIALGPEAQEFAIGDRVGVPWLGGTDRACFHCTHGMENLCDRPTITGFTRDGGYATHVLADSRYCLTIPAVFDDVHAAPLLCAGLIGYRALKLAGRGMRLGFYGFGASAHILAQVAAWQSCEVFAFTRDGDTERQDFARSLGCVWAGRVERSASACVRCSNHLRVGRGARSDGAEARPQRRHGGVRRHPHKRHPGVPGMNSCGASASSGRWPI